MADWAIDDTPLMVCAMHARFAPCRSCTGTDNWTTDAATINLVGEVQALRVLTDRLAKIIERAIPIAPLHEDCQSVLADYRKTRGVTV